MGEWGGGLVRWTGGEPRLVERRDSTGLCDGPLNSDCDPVTAVLPDNRDGRCVIAAVALRHFYEHGRVLRVCGDDVEVIYEEAYADGRGTRGAFGLAAAPGGFWATTGDGALRFAWGSREPERHAFPELVERSGVWLSTAVPGAIVLATTVNWAASLSGGTPLLVSTE